MTTPPFANTTPTPALLPIGSARPRAAPRNALWGLWGAVLFFLLIGVALAAFSVWSTRAEAVAVAEDDVSRLVQRVESTLNRNLLGVDMSLVGIEEQLQAMTRLSGRATDVGTMRDILHTALRQNLLFSDVSIYDAKLEQVARGQRQGLSERRTPPTAFLRDALAQNFPSLKVSSPVFLRDASERVLFLARPAKLPNGDKVLLVAEVSVLVLSSVISQTSFLGTVVVTVEGEDGMLYVSSPVDESKVATRLAKPVASDQWDGGARVIRGRLNDETYFLAARPTVYPGLLVTVGLPAGIALSAWHSRMVMISTITCGVVLLVLFATVLAHAYLLRLNRTQRVLEKTKTDLERSNLQLQTEIRERTRAAQGQAEAQSMLDQALHVMEDGFLLCDAQDRVVRWNPRYLEIFPYLEPILKPGVTFHELVELAADVRCKHMDANERKEWIRAREQMHRTKNARVLLDVAVDNKSNIIEVIERATPDSGVVSVFRDVTETKRYESQLAEAKLAAEAANLAKSQFLTAMSHEIRTPLNGVLGMNGLLLETSLTAEQRRYAEIIRNSGETLLTLINDILDLSRLEAGKMELESVDFAVADTVNEVVSLLEGRARSNGLTLKTSLDAGPAVRLNGDSNRIRQLLFNLVGNAIKFTKKGGVQVLAKTRPNGDGLVELVLEVADTGIGIPQSALPKLFEFFSQADNSMARRFGGSGLGLAICRQLVTLMGGKITVASEVGVGSTFTVRLPLKRAEDVEDPSTRPDTAHSFIREAPRLHLLVAEDVPVNQLLIRTLLAKMGHTCDMAITGEEVLEMLDDAHYDAILMDIQMPIMDGVEATQRIRAMSGPLSNIPIIALTANAMVEDRQAYLAAGMNAYISKPINPAVLRKTLAEVGFAIRDTET